MSKETEEVIDKMVEQGEVIFLQEFGSWTGAMHPNNGYFVAETPTAFGVYDDEEKAVVSYPSIEELVLYLQSILADMRVNEEEVEAAISGLRKLEANRWLTRLIRRS